MIYIYIFYTEWDSVSEWHFNVDNAISLMNPTKSEKLQKCIKLKKVDFFLLLLKHFHVFSFNSVFDWICWSIRCSTRLIQFVIDIVSKCYCAKSLVIKINCGDFRMVAVWAIKLIPICITMVVSMEIPRTYKSLCVKSWVRDLMINRWSVMRRLLLKV